MEVENWPAFCKFCDRVGHLEDVCFKKNPGLKPFGSNRENPRWKGKGPEPTTRQIYLEKGRDNGKGVADPIQGGESQEQLGSSDAQGKTTDQTLVVAGLDLHQTIRTPGPETVAFGQVPTNVRSCGGEAGEKDNDNDNGMPPLLSVVAEMECHMQQPAEIQYAASELQTAMAHKEAWPTAGQLCAGPEPRMQREETRPGAAAVVQSRAIVDIGGLTVELPCESSQVAELGIAGTVAGPTQREQNASKEVADRDQKRHSTDLRGEPRGSVSEGEEEEETDSLDSGSHTCMGATVLRLNIDQSRVMDHGNKQTKKKGVRVPGPSDRQLRSAVMHSQNSSLPLPHD